MTTYLTLAILLMTGCVIETYWVSILIISTIQTIISTWTAVKNNASFMIVLLFSNSVFIWQLGKRWNKHGTYWESSMELFTVHNLSHFTAHSITNLLYTLQISQSYVCNSKKPKDYCFSWKYLSKIIQNIYSRHKESLPSVF